MTAPRLTRRDLAADLDRIYGADREHFLVAFHGTGDADQLEVRGATVRIVPVRGELELRRQLLGVGDADRVAFLVPWTVEIPLDLQGRFARHGRVFRISRNIRLGKLFGGVAEIDEDVHGSPLGAYLLTHHENDNFSVADGKLTIDAMWRAWLRTLGLEVGGELALDVLLGWAAIDGRGPQFVDTMAARSAAEVRDALVAHLGVKLGPAGPVVWKSWESGRGSAALELALVLGALGSSVTDDPVVAVWARTTVNLALGTASPEVLVRLGAAADTALRYVGRKAGAEHVRRLVHAADGRAADDAVLPHLVASTRLPSAWRTRLALLGDSLAAVAVAPGEVNAQEALERLRLLRGHELFASGENTAVVERAEMAVRLAGWLASWSRVAFEPSMTPYGDVETLASWYVREGGYVDWARRAARGVADDGFGRGVAALLASVDRVRQELDRRFARALPHWHDARRPETGVVAIDHAVKRFVTSFLDEEPARRLLVVLMDGMAWAQASELLASMDGGGSVWAPLAWHAIGAQRVGDAPFPPVLTNFPTLTEVSRAAFFAGKAMPVGTAVSSQDDVKRWQGNRDALRYAVLPDTPQLLLRGEGQTRDGSASTDALSRVADPARRLVAVVINAIDMSLKSDAAQRHRWSVETVKSLRDLLDKAAEHGRAVLLCSDHGHVPADRFEAAGPMKDGARWRVWQTPEEPLAEFEVGLRAGDGVWAPRGAHGVVLISDDAHRYGGGAGSGEHGGATLAEVVAPCLFIGNGDAPGAGNDRGQAVRPVRPPSWWNFDLIGGAGVVEPADRRPRRTKQASPPDAQLSLTGLPTPPPADPPRKAPVISPLAGSELLAARAPKAADRERVVIAVEFLRARNGVADAAAFAAELGEFPARVSGLVTRLQEILNVDGYQVLRFERQAKQVHLDVEKLAQQFEIAL